MRVIAAILDGENARIANDEDLSAQFDELRDRSFAQFGLHIRGSKSQAQRACEEIFNRHGVRAYVSYERTVGHGASVSPSDDQSQTAKAANENFRGALIASQFIDPRPFQS